jgi:hypothetical protein
MSKRLQSFRLLAYRRQHRRCYYCGVPMWLRSPDELPAAAPSTGAAAAIRGTAEHLLPRCEGGTDSPDNIAAACARCNCTRHRRKHPPSASEYRRQVAQRVAAGGWHHKWVYEAGLLNGRDARKTKLQP